MCGKLPLHKVADSIGTDDAFSDRGGSKAGEGGTLGRVSGLDSGSTTFKFRNKY